MQAKHQDGCHNCCENSESTIFFCDMYLDERGMGEVNANDAKIVKLLGEVQPYLG